MTTADLSPTLAHRLERAGSSGGQAGTSIVLSLFFGGIATALILYAYTYTEGSDAWPMYGVGGFLALLGLFFLYCGIHQLFSLKTAETMVEISEPQLTRGKEVRFFFRQPGPVSLQSLRANLVGEETWIQSSSDHTTNKSKYLGTFNFFDSGPQEIVAERPFEAFATFFVPGDILPSGRTPEGHRVAWKIEVWGKVRGRADFQHPYAIEVT